MMQFRTGPHLGIPYEVALDLGLDSALRGRSYYDNLTHTLIVTKPSERLLGHHADTLITDDLGGYKAYRAAIKPFKWPDEETRKGAMVAFYGGITEARIQAFMDACVADLHMCALHTSILKPARKEKPE